VCSLILLPPLFWNKLFDFIHNRRSSWRVKITVYFDGTSEYCVNMMSILRTFVLLPDTKIVKAQDTDPQVLEYMHSDSSFWIVCEHPNRDHLGSMSVPEKRYSGLDAVERVLKESPLFWLIGLPLRWKMVRKITRMIYGWLAASEMTEEFIRKRMKVNTKKLTAEEDNFYFNLRATRKFVVELMACFFMLYVILWNYAFLMVCIYHSIAF
jgi:predicted DCC family thiol-disulfide oxidoreductase YuxK